jgi:hypothetical protein
MEKWRMMKRARFLFIGVGCLLMAALILVLLKSLRTTMIVEIGIIATNTLRTVIMLVFVIAGLLALAIGSYQMITGILKNSSNNRLKKSSLSYRAKTSGQKEIRNQLMVMKEVRPRLAGEIDKCLEQLDGMASQFARFDQLITSNDAEAVSGARIGLEEIEKTLCANFKWVINSSIAAAEDDSPEADAFYAQCIERIERVVGANNRALEKGNQFLLEIADNISQIGAGNTTMLDAWIETIRAQNRQSLIETGG